MYRKIVLMLLTLMMLAVSVAFASERDNAPAYPDFAWKRDAFNHWQMKEDGTKGEPQAHAVDEESMICSVCGTEVWLFEDGSASLTNYNEQGDTVQNTSYEAGGESVWDVARIFVYDEADNKKHEYQYENGLFVSQTAYAIGPDEENHPVWLETYYDDGTWGRNEYDAYGNCINAYAYDADDSVVSQTISEYALNEDGWYYEAKSTTYMEGDVFVSEYNQYGDKTYTYIYSPEEGTIFDTRRVYEYKDGQKVYSKQYEKDVLVMEAFYDEDGNTMKEIEYLEDGTTVIYEYDEDGELIEN